MTIEIINNTDVNTDSIVEGWRKGNANFAFLATPRWRFQASKGGVDQTNIVPGFAGTKVTFDTTSFAIPAASFDVGKSAWTPPAGTFFISGQLYFVNDPNNTPLTPGDVVAAAIYKNGSPIAQGISTVAATPLGIFGFVQVAYTDVANGTDYYEVYAVVSPTISGTKTISGLNAGTFFSGHSVG